MSTISNIWDTGYKQLFGVSENYYDDNSLLNIPAILLNNITSSVSSVFSSISSMTFGGEPTKKPGKMMALKSSGENVIIPNFLTSDVNGNLDVFDLDKHTSTYGFSAASLTALTGDIKVPTGAQLCIGSTCISEADLKQLGYDGKSHESVIAYKPSDIYNKLAMKTPGRTYTRYFYKSSLPASEQAGVPLFEGNIVTEMPAGADGYIKQTIYDTNTVPNVACRYSKTSLKNIANDDNWGPFSVVGTPFYQGSNGLLMTNWKITDTNDAVRFHHDADRNVVAQKMGVDDKSQKFIVENNGKPWSKSTGYLDTVVKYGDNIRINTPSIIYPKGGSYLWVHTDNQHEVLVRGSDDNKHGKFKLEKI